MSDNLDTTVKKLYENLNKWRKSKHEVVEELKDLADNLDIHFKKISKAKVLGSVTSIGGGIMAGIGFGLSFATFGASLGLTLAGSIIAGAGGVTVGGSMITDAVLSGIHRKSAQEILDEYNKLVETIKKECIQIGDLLKEEDLKMEHCKHWIAFWKTLISAAHTDEVLAAGARTGTTAFKALGTTAARAGHVVEGVRVSKPSMASNTSLCVICDLRHFTSSSTHWCAECEEALCTNCKDHHNLSKASRGHEIIPISEYNNLPSTIVNIDLYCTYYNEKYVQYCVEHECPTCYKCIKEHGNCSELKVLEGLAGGVKIFRGFSRYGSKRRKYNGNREHEEACFRYKSILVYERNPKKVTKHEKSILSIVEDKQIERVDIECTIDAMMKDFLTYTTKFGSIHVKNHPSDLIEIVRKIDGQTQILEVEKGQSVNNIKLNFNQKLETSCDEIRGCGVTVSGGFFFTDYHNIGEKLVVLSADGMPEETIHLSEQYSSFDLVCIDDDTVAVTTGDSYIDTEKGLLIVDLTIGNVITAVDLPSIPYGITFDGKSIILCCEGEDLQMILYRDLTISTIPNTLMSECSYLVTHADKIFYTHASDNRVSCCLYSGEPVWVFKNEKSLKEPTRNYRR
ncbi:unnamed protein product [Mytilus coruscus]|uniref:B box-type domain-containing protein n=1 Tax=Mytilus coruscus TaxID=42192 RepID=A0A6J8C5C5_MYTCO|nr:unnamed protein product [Mytilus coruscus]